MALPLFDANVLLRHVTRDHADQSPRSTAFFGKLARNEARVRCSEQVIFEASYTLLGMYRATRAEVSDALLAFINLAGVVLPRKSWWSEIFDLFTSSALSLPDSYHVVMMRRLGITEIVSFDTDFDRVPGITRVEP